MQQRLSSGLLRGVLVIDEANFNKPVLWEKVEGLTEEQKRIRQLERELREVKLEHEILKKAAAGARYASFPGANGTVPIYKSESRNLPGGKDV